MTTPQARRERAATKSECLANRIMALRDERCEAHQHYLCDLCAGQWIDVFAAQEAEQITTAHGRMMTERDRWQEISRNTMVALCEVDTDIRLDYDGDEVAYARAVVAQLHEFRAKYHDVMDVLARSDTLDTSEASGRALEEERAREAEQASAQARAAERKWWLDMSEELFPCIAAGRSKGSCAHEGWLDCLLDAAALRAAPAPGGEIG